jgi:hypothetical protein
VVANMARHFNPRLLDTSVPPPGINHFVNPQQILTILTPFLHLIDQRLGKLTLEINQIENRRCDKCSRQTVLPPISQSALPSQLEPLACRVPPYPPAWRLDRGRVHPSAFSVHHLQREAEGASDWQEARKSMRLPRGDLNARTADSDLNIRNRFETLTSQNLSSPGKIINIIEGSVMDSTASLVHCVAADFHEARGVAVDMKASYGKTDYLRSMGKVAGEVATMPIRENDYLFNLVTKMESKHKPRRVHLRQCLWELRETCLNLGVTRLAMPKIGSGYDNLSWDQTEDDLRMVFAGSGIQVDVYVLPPEAAAAYAEREKARRQQAAERRGTQAGGRRRKSPTPPRARVPPAGASRTQTSSPPAPQQRARSPLRVVEVIMPSQPQEVEVVDLDSSKSAVPPQPAEAVLRDIASPPPADKSAEGELEFSTPAAPTTTQNTSPLSQTFLFCAPDKVATANTKVKQKQDFVRINTRSKKK